MLAVGQEGLRWVMKVGCGSGGSVVGNEGWS